MKQFAIIAPAGLAEASKLLAHRGNLALAGGVDVLDLLKQEIIEPQRLINLKTLKGLDRIDSDESGMRIGALVKLKQLTTERVILTNYSALADAAREAATPQIRNLATVGGNLLQRPRCWYFRNPDVDCLKKGGLRCYAKDGLHRYHSIVGGGPSYIVHPSNLAVALVALSASAKLVGASGERTVELEQFFVLPNKDPLRENVLEPGEVMTEIRLPAPERATRSVYIEAREKQSFDWPLVSVAAVIATENGIVRDARIVMGAVAPIPWRSKEGERALMGMHLNEETAADAAEAALRQATPLPQNRYKVPIAKALVRRAVLRAGNVEDAA